MSLPLCSFSLRFRRAFAEEPCHANPDQVVPQAPGNCEQAYILKNILLSLISSYYFHRVVIVQFA